MNKNRFLERLKNTDIFMDNIGIRNLGIEESLSERLVGTEAINVNITLNTYTTYSVGIPSNSYPLYGGDIMPNKNNDHIDSTLDFFKSFEGNLISDLHSKIVTLKEALISERQKLGKKKIDAIFSLYSEGLFEVDDVLSLGKIDFYEFRDYLNKNNIPFRYEKDYCDKIEEFGDLL